MDIFIQIIKGFGMVTCISTVICVLTLIAFWLHGLTDNDVVDLISTCIGIAVVLTLLYIVGGLIL